MAGNCIVCGKEFYDNSRSHSKLFCSDKCKRVYKFRDPDKKFNQLLRGRLNNLRNKYGVEFDEPTKERIRQDLKIGECYICKQKSSSRNTVIDHDHITGEYRGILCQRHNKALGNINDSPIEAITLCRYLIAKSASGIDFRVGLWGNAIEDEAQTLMDMVKVD